jgi:hypothetical protein
MNHDLTIPFVDERLLDYLQRLFPDKAPELKDTDREVWFHRGSAEVIRHLQHLRSQQQENILGK